MIKLFESFNEYNQVKEWLDRMEVLNYTINDDLTVDVNGSVSISNSDLTEIPIQFRKVSVNFHCNDNFLTSLKGCPEYVGGIFACNDTMITSLEYSPKYVGTIFFCQNNIKLASLKGCTEKVGGGHHIGTNNNLPNEIKKFFKDITPRDVIKHQEEYGIWNTDGSFNKGRWGILLKDLEAGIIK